MRSIARALSTSRPLLWEGSMEELFAAQNVGKALALAKGAHRFVRVVDVASPSPTDLSPAVLKTDLPASLEAAYVAQQAMRVEAVERHGLHVVGWKAGATNDGAMQQLGLQTPFWGPIFDKDVITAPARVRTGHYELRGAELEYVFEFGRDLPLQDTDFREEQVKQAVAWVYPAIEIVGTRFARGTAMNANCLIADQAGHGGLVTGRHLKLDAAAFQEMSMESSVVLSINGQEVARGNGLAVMGDPWRSVGWVANALRRSGIALNQGDIISSGTMVGKPPVAPGDEIVGQFEGFGLIRAQLDTL
jgi:2-keto-4-pentenoate hydratase